jgi:GT2 family glycosyltransferase
MTVSVGVVAIGRNEGQRLRRCLESLVGVAHAVVYVDSGSTDGSISMAQSLGAAVVELTPTIPFTAARARNAGFRLLRDTAPECRYVQFVDGDCEVVHGWIPRAVSFLEEHVDVAVVCGRRRERHPEHSIYNRLLDLEWDSPIGESKACGGDALIRTEVLESVGGYREDLIAGEEPEMCLRVRAAGWRVWRIDHEMTVHDAAMTRFSQWWRRSMRAGHAFAEGAHLHGAPPERHFVRESRRSLIWGLLLPAFIAVAAIGGGRSVALLLGFYPLQVVRIAARAPGGWREGLLGACFAVLGKFPEAIGNLKFVLRRLLRGRIRLVEYK